MKNFNWERPNTPAHGCLIAGLLALLLWLSLAALAAAWLLHLVG